MEQHRQTLLISGAVLFLIGILSGVAVPAMENPRMGLSAHLAGVQNAIFLLAIGAAWGHTRLPHGLERAAVWLGIVSMVGFWAALQLAAIWGSSRATPIAGAGFAAVAWQETIVDWALRLSSGAAIVSAALVALGFWRGRSFASGNRTESV